MNHLNLGFYNLAIYSVSIYLFVCFEAQEVSRVSMNNSMVCKQVIRECVKGTPNSKGITSMLVAFLFL